MLIKNNATKKPLELNFTNYKPFNDETAILGKGVCAIRMSLSVEKPVIESNVMGFDDNYRYMYFFTDKNPRGYNDRVYTVKDNRYLLLMSGEAPIRVDEHVLEELPILEFHKLEGREQLDAIDGDENFDATARMYFMKFDFVKYNKLVYYFDKDRLLWRRLVSYEDYNILICKHSKKYKKTEKTQIIDSLQIYLDDLPETTIDKNLLLFNNNVVLNILTGEVHDFDGSQFIISKMTANWYEDFDDCPKVDKYLTTVLDTLCGRNTSVKSEESAKRKRDLLIYIGYMLSNMDKQSAIILYGGGQNGKSTLARLICKVKNSAFNIKVPTLLSDNHYMSAFYNERVLFLDELKPAMVTDDFISVYNQLIGNRLQSIRPLQKEAVSVEVNFTLIGTANKLSEKFFMDRPLLRRTKIMNAKFPITSKFRSDIQLDDEVQKQNNVDWLANYCIREFMKNNYNIDDLFADDIVYWLKQMNPTVKKFTKYLYDIKLLDSDYKVIGSESEFKRKLVMLGDMHKRLTSTHPMEVFDEQLNIIFHYVFNMYELNCQNGIINWDYRAKKILD